MADASDSRSGLRSAVRHVSHPRLVGTTIVGVCLVGVGVLLFGTAPTLAVRIGFLGAIVALFGLSGYVAMRVSELGDARRGAS